MTASKISTREWSAGTAREIAWHLFVVEFEHGKHGVVVGVGAVVVFELGGVVVDVVDVVEFELIGVVLAIMLVVFEL